MGVLSLTLLVGDLPLDLDLGVCRVLDLDLRLGAFGGVTDLDLVLELALRLSLSSCSLLDLDLKPSL